MCSKKKKILLQVLMAGVFDNFKREDQLFVRKENDLYIVSDKNKIDFGLVNKIRRGSLLSLKQRGKYFTGKVKKVKHRLMIVLVEC